MMDDGQVVVAVIMVVILTIIVVVAGSEIGVKDSHIKRLQAEAVQRGHAEWVVYQETGETEWRWKENDDE